MASKAAGGLASRVAAMASRVASAVRGPSAPQTMEEATHEVMDRLQKETGHGRLVKATASKHGRLIYLANIPIRMQLPPRTDNLIELAFRVPPRTTKLEVKKILQLVYGIDVLKVHTINYDGKKKFNPNKKFYYRTAAYKKAYVVLNRPISLSKDLFPLNLFYGQKEGQPQPQPAAAPAAEEAPKAEQT